MLNEFCVEYTASLIIENKYFDIRHKSALTKPEKCPYNEFPSNLNIPRWIYVDTSYSINSLQRFKVKNQQTINTYTVEKQSLFKFYLPDEDEINFHNSITLSLEKNNRKKELIRKMDSNDNYLALLLNEGKYILEFTFELNEHRAYFISFGENDYEHLCYFHNIFCKLSKFCHFVALTRCKSTSFGYF